MSEEINYNDYTFEPSKELVITTEMYNILNRKTRELLEKQRQNLVPLKFKLYDTKKEQFVSKRTKANSQFIKEMFDPEATMNARIQEHITPEGQELLRMISVLDAVHMVNVDRGNAIKFEDLAEKNKPKMETVE